MLKYGDETGPDEMWGVVATKVGSNWLATENQVTEAFVYTGEACLTIERVDEAEDGARGIRSPHWTGTRVAQHVPGGRARAASTVWAPRSRSPAA